MSWDTVIVNSRLDWGCRYHFQDGVSQGSWSEDLISSQLLMGGLCSYHLGTSISFLECPYHLTTCFMELWLESLQRCLLSFPSGASGKESACQCGCKRWRFNPWWRRSPGGGNGKPLHYFYMGNPMDRGAWQATVHGATKSQTWLSDWAHKGVFDDLSSEVTPIISETSCCLHKSALFSKKGITGGMSAKTQNHLGSFCGVAATTYIGT